MRKKTRKIVISALMMAIGLVLPFFTAQIQTIGKMLLPMHLPVLVLGFVCGWQYGAAVGFALPILRSLLFGMPILYPSAVGMAFELATYGLVTGLIYSHRKKKNIFSVYTALIPAMIAGRIIWGAVMTFLMAAGGNAFTVAAFFAGAVADSFVGIVLQLILVPLIVTLISSQTKRGVQNGI